MQSSLHPILIEAPDDPKYWGKGPMEKLGASPDLSKIPPMFFQPLEIILTISG